MSLPHRNVTGRVGQVPKVTWRRPRAGWFVALFPAPCGAYQPVGDDAEEEIDDQAGVELEWAMAGCGKRGCEKEVGDVAEDDCD